MLFKKLELILRQSRMFRFAGILIFLSIIILNSSFAQDDKSERQKKFTRDSIPELDLTPDSVDQQEQKRKKKLKKKEFYGLKCKKGWTKTGKREKQVIETFFYLKVFKMPDPYIKDLFVYDVKERKIIEVDEIKEEDKNRYKILHGPYKRTVGGNVTETGIFYVGMKHARWEKYGKNLVLLDKSKFYRGWPKDAEISYFDGNHKKVKEVKPFKFGSLNGTYYLFNEEGRVLQHGKYKDNQKIGTWVEYFKDREKRRKEIKYPLDPYTGDQFQPFTLNEWNDQGDPIIRNGEPFNPSKATKKSSRPPRKNK